MRIFKECLSKERQRENEMPTGVNEYKRTCVRCDKNINAKMGGQLYCNICGKIVERMRKRGFVGSYSKIKEERFTKGKK